MPVLLRRCAILTVPALVFWCIALVRTEGDVLEALVVVLASVAFTAALFWFIKFASENWD